MIFFYLKPTQYTAKICGIKLFISQHLYQFVHYELIQAVTKRIIQFKLVANGTLVNSKYTCITIHNYSWYKALCKYAYYLKTSVNTEKHVVICKSVFIAQVKI